MKTVLAFLLAMAVTLGVAAALPAAEPGPVAIRVDKEQVDFLAGKDLVARYHIGPSVAKPYFWPVNGPNGMPITRGWPMVKGLPDETADHVHQKSLWFCHGDVIPQGVETKDKIKGVEGVDFWSEGKGHGVIACVAVAQPMLDKNHGWVLTRNEWRTADGTRIMDEDRTIHLYDLGDAKLLVFDIDLCASVTPIVFGDTKEGSFGVRINDQIREAKGGKLENAEGKVGEKAVWGQRSAWCDYSGTLGGKTVGLAVFDDPNNPHPACWHARGYGLLAANPFGRARSGFAGAKDGRELVKLAKGDHLKLRYGVLIHSGDARDGKVADYFQQFVKLRS